MFEPPGGTGGSAEGFDVFDDAVMCDEDIVDEESG